MDVAPQTVHATPGPQVTQQELTLVNDAAILTNTVVPAAPSTRILNPTAIALDNPAGTGAPFDKKDQVYKIYQRWPEKSTTINGALAAGAEVLRISLNPMTLPSRILDWVNFHKSCIPAIDVAIAIGGAAGTISWLTLGWIADDSEAVTLDSLQQVACEHFNMNNTMVMRFGLNDNRRSALFRRLPDDGEPWPAMVLMVNHPALNVQRNDDVNYPIDVYVRLAPNAIFMEPFNVIGSGGGSSTTIDLSYYIKIDSVDILIGVPNACNPETDVIDLPDSGWNTGQFIPNFTENNFLTARCSQNGALTKCFLAQEGFTPGKAELDAAYDRINPGGGKPYAAPLQMAFGFGTVPKRLLNAKWPQTAGEPEGTYGGTVYSIQPYTVLCGALRYTATQIRVYEFGCVIIFSTKYAVVGNWMVINCLVDPYTPESGLLLPFYDDKAQDEWIMYSNKSGDATTNFQLAANVGLTYNTVYTEPWRIRSGIVPENRFYTFTYVQTGNVASSSTLPTGLKTITLVRPGTTTTLEDYSAFWPIMAPDLRGAKSALEQLRAKLNTVWLAFEVEINGQSFGTCVYAEGIMACRTSTPRQIRTGVPKQIIAKNIRAIANPSAIPNLLTDGFTNWWSSPAAVKLQLPAATRTIRPRFSNVPMQKEAAGFGIGAVAGLTNGLMDWYTQWQRNEWNKEYQGKQIQMYLDLMRGQGQNQRDLARQNFEQQMSLRGYSAPSANNAQRLNQETNTESVPEENPTSRADSSTSPEPLAQTMSSGVTTDIRGSEINSPSQNQEYNSKYLVGAVPTPFRQAQNLAEGRGQSDVPSIPPKTTRDNEEQLPGYSAFDPTSIGLPYEEVEDFVRGEPKRTAFRLPNEDKAIPSPPPLPPGNSELLLGGNSSSTQNFSRNDPSRQALRRVRTEQNLPAATSRSEPHSQENEMPYSFLRYDDMRMGKRDFTGSQFAPQQFIRNGPGRQANHSYPSSIYGPSNFQRNDPTRIGSRSLSSQNYPPQHFIRNSPARQPIRDFAGIPGLETTSQPVAPSTTTERLI